MDPRPILKFLRWVRFIDRIQHWAKGELSHREHKEAARELVDERTTRTLEYRRFDPSNRFYADKYQWAHPEIIEFWEHFFSACDKRNIPVRAFEIYRSNERQDELFKTGRSKAKAGTSPHNIGMAVDIVGYKKYWDLSKKQWDVLGEIGKEVARKRKIDIEWGGDWNFYDPAHWELKTIDVLMGVKENGRAKFEKRSWKDYRSAEKWRIENNMQLPEQTSKRFEMWENIYNTEIRFNPD